MCAEETLWLTVDPADADGLTEGEQQQRGAAAHVMVQQLQQVHAALRRTHFISTLIIPRAANKTLV